MTARPHCWAIGSAAAVWIAVAAAYAPSLGNGLVWDDRIHVLDNPVVQQARWAEILGRPVGNFHRPVVFASFALESQLVGTAPALMHLTNLVLHAGVACLLLATAVATGVPRGIALAAALLWALQPVQSEAVLYVSGRTDLLAAGLALIALRLHARAAGWSGVAGGCVAFAGALGGFALALGCKESVACVPLAFAVGDRVFARRRGRDARADFLRWFAYACVLGAWVAWRASLPGQPLQLAWTGDLPARLAGTLAAVASYARLLVWPVGLHLERFVAGGNPWISGTGLVVALIWLVSGLRARPAVAFWLAWAAAAYLPTANLLPVYPGLPPGTVFAAEHFLYLPSAGVFVAAAIAIGTRVPPRFALLLVCLLLPTFAAIVWDRARDWQDGETLYRHTLEYAPKSARVRLNLGNLYLERGETERAADQFAAGLAAHPSDSDLLTNAGLAWLSLGQIVTAEGALKRVIELAPEDAQAWANLGALYGTTGRFDAARRAYGQALRRGPSNADAQAGLRILDEFAP
jgi:hypothetical protein